LGDYFRRMKSKLGHIQAIIAVAHKLARIIYHMVKEKVEYDESIDRMKNVNMLDKKRKSLQKRLAKIEAELSSYACNSGNLGLVR